MDLNDLEKHYIMSDLEDEGTTKKVSNKPALVPDMITPKVIANPSNESQTPVIKKKTPLKANDASLS